MKFNVNNLSVFSMIILLILLSQANEIFAGAWPQKKGTGYYKADFRYLSGNKIYNSDGEKVAIPDFTNMTVGVAGFYGFTDNLTFILNASVYNSVKLDTTTTALGFDNEVKDLVILSLAQNMDWQNSGSQLSAESFY